MLVCKAHCVMRTHKCRWQMLFFFFCFSLIYLELFSFFNLSSFSSVYFGVYVHMTIWLFACLPKFAHLMVNFDIDYVCARVVCSSFSMKHENLRSNLITFAECLFIFNIRSMSNITHVLNHIISFQIMYNRQHLMMCKMFSQTFFLWGFFGLPGRVLQHCLSTRPKPYAISVH